MVTVGESVAVGQGSKIEKKNPAMQPLFSKFLFFKGLTAKIEVWSEDAVKIVSAGWKKDSSIATRERDRRSALCAPSNSISWMASRTDTVTSTNTLFALVAHTFSHHDTSQD